MNKCSNRYISKDISLKKIIRNMPINKSVNSYMLFSLSVLLVGCSYSPLPELQPNQIRVNATDTLEVLADKYDVTVKELIEYNGVNYPYHIHVGQILRIPEINDEQELAQENSKSGALIGDHAVKKNDNLSSGVNINVPRKQKDVDYSDNSMDSDTPAANDFAKALKKKLDQKRVAAKIETKEIIDEQNEQSDDNDIEPEMSKDLNKDIKKTDHMDVKVPVKQTEKQKKQETNDDNDIEPGNEAVKVDEEKDDESLQSKPLEAKQITNRESKFIAPLSGFENITVNPKSKTLRLKSKQDPNIYAVEDGEVFVSDKSYPAMGGRMVVIKHKINGTVYLSVYGGMPEINANILNRSKKIIKKGEILGNLGLTKDKKHVLNFELRKENQQISPETMIEAFKRSDVKTTSGGGRMNTNMQKSNAAKKPLNPKNKKK